MAQKQPVAELVQNLVQGTTYEITQGECRALARRGPVYNPYKQQRRGDAGRPSESPPTPVAHADPAPAATLVD